MLLYEPTGWSTMDGCYQYRNRPITWLVKWIENHPPQFNWGVKPWLAVMRRLDRYRFIWHQRG